MRRFLATAAVSVVLLAVGEAQAQLAPKIENPTGQYLVWGDYKVEVNQYGGLGRNWPTPDLFWEGYEILRRKAEANTASPNTLRTVLLVCPTTEATAVKVEDGEEVVVGTRKTSMTSAELKWNIDQWREFEEMVYLFSGGNAWLRTDVKVIDEPLKVKTDEKWRFWGGQQREFLDKYIPFERGDYQSYNCIYNSKGMNAGPHGGTIGAIGGIKGCGTSDNAFYGRGRRIDERTGYVALHEWLNQQCSATSNMMPYPDGETLWNNYVLHKIGYREDVELNPWPWVSLRRDTMTQIIRPTMWRRWSGVDPYKSVPIGQWILFAERPAGQAREVTSAPASEGRLVERRMDRTSQFNLLDIRGTDGREWYEGTLYFRTYVASESEQEVRLWAAADERFQLWLNGVMIRDGWGWNYSEDDGQLFEKVSYPTMKKGINTLVLVVPNENHKAEFRVRFCRTDGSGEEPEGLTTFPTLSAGQQALPLEEPVVHDFTNPRFYKWAEINDDPWMLMPRIDETALRELTGIETLTIKTDGTPWTAENGTKYDPPQQHLFFEVPQAAVASPWIQEPLENNAQLNNDMDYNWKSMAWLRVPGRSGPEKDLVFLRFDVAEPLMHLLKTKGRSAQDSIVGWLLVEHKLAYVVLVDLDVDEAPEKPVGLLSKQPE